MDHGKQYVCISDRYEENKKESVCVCVTERNREKVSGLVRSERRRNN